MGPGFYPLETLPNPFDIVWCRWPQHGEGIEPGPVVRPVLVLAADVFEHEEGFKYGSLIIQYGGNFDDRHLQDNLYLSGVQARLVGLHKETVFRLDLRNRRQLPWREKYFASQGYVRNQPIIAGSLSEDQQQIVLECLRRRRLQFPPP